MRSLWKENILFISLIKLLFVIFISLYLEDYWIYCGKKASQLDKVLDSCNSNDIDVCSSFCDSISIVNVSVKATPYPDIRLSETGGYCRATFESSCACVYWEIFKLVPILLHVLQFGIQCVCLWLFSNFNPQQNQYMILEDFIFSSLLLKSDTIPEADVSMSYAESSFYVRCKYLMISLSKFPMVCIFSFLETITVIYVWMELIYGQTVNCDNSIRLSSVYYPILMTLLDFGKLNIYISSMYMKNKQYALSMISIFKVIV